MKICLLIFVFIAAGEACHSWGFFAHRKINNYAVFLLPPEMMVLYKQKINFLTEHAVDPDMRRYAVKDEGPRHYIDIDHYADFPMDSLPGKWKDAIVKIPEDSLKQYGIVPWWVQTMLYRLTEAFRKKDETRILKLSAEIGHYIADAHVPLHANSNHNGQKTNQQGIHGFWESRVPELLAEHEWNFFVGKAIYLDEPAAFIWARVRESAAASDSVLQIEAALTKEFSPDQKFSFENRNGITIRQYSSAFSKAYNQKLNGMIERRMRAAIFAVASFWYTAWINAGSPDLASLSHRKFSETELADFEQISKAWKQEKIKGREHELPLP